MKSKIFDKKKSKLSTIFMSLSSGIIQICSKMHLKQAGLDILALTPKLRSVKNFPLIEKIRYGKLTSTVVHIVPPE